MPLINKPPFNAPTPVGQNILPPSSPQAPVPPAPSAAPQGQSSPSPQQAPAPQNNLQQAQPTQPPKQNNDTGTSPFDAPIPGQSLTETPGNATWEHPPQYTDPKKAADMVWSQLMNPKNIEHLVLMLHKGTPAEAIARTVLFGGFTQGKWTPDVAMLIAKPVLAMIVGIGAQAGIDNMKITMPKDKNDPEDPLNMMAKAQVAEKAAKPAKSPEERKKDFIDGFLPRKIGA